MRRVQEHETSVELSLGAFRSWGLGFGVYKITPMFDGFQWSYKP